MEKKLKIVKPVYQQIAGDIASKIANGYYQVGDKIYARSVLASQYGVSSETARRAIAILTDLNIVEAIKGSGVSITSSENAIKFVKQFENIETVNNLKNDIFHSIERQKIDNNNLKDQLTELIDKMDRFKEINPFIPFEISITKETQYINKNLAEINFWHNTSATIIGIKRDGYLHMSPGPYAILCENDVFYFVGDEDSHERVNKFLYPEI